VDSKGEGVGVPFGTSKYPAPLRVTINECGIVNKLPHEPEIAKGVCSVGGIEWLDHCCIADTEAGQKLNNRPAIEWE